MIIIMDLWGSQTSVGRAALNFRKESYMEMTSRAKLRCKVIENTAHGLVVSGKTCNGEPFNMSLQDIDLRGYDPQTGNCWVEVDFFGKSNDKASIGMPAADIRMGKNVTVSIDDIDRTEEIMRVLAEKAKKNSSQA